MLVDVLSSANLLCHVLSRAGAKKGERVLIHGASGAVGLAAVQIAKAHGMYVQNFSP